MDHVKAPSRLDRRSIVMCGHRQALEAVKHLTTVGFDVAYASDLSRALETAKTILGEQSNPVSLVADNGLRTISDGIYERRSIAERRRS